MIAFEDAKRDHSMYLKWEVDVAGLKKKVTDYNVVIKEKKARIQELEQQHSNLICGPPMSKNDCDLVLDIKKEKELVEKELSSVEHHEWTWRQEYFKSKDKTEAMGEMRDKAHKSYPDLIQQ